MNKNNFLAKELRKNPTPQEYKFWQIIRAHRFYGLFFRRQYSIGDYIVDFICRSKKIIIELDGGHHNNSQNIEYDKERTLYLESKGYKVIRFWNADIDSNIEGVFLKMKDIFNIKV